MKKIIAILLFTNLTFSSLAIAEETGERIEEFKQIMARHIDREIGILTQFKTCIQAAQKRADFETCKNTKNEAQKNTVVEMKKERLENRKKQLAVEEKQLNEAAKPDKK